LNIEAARSAPKRGVTAAFAAPEKNCTELADELEEEAGDAVDAGDELEEEAVDAVDAGDEAAIFKFH